MTKIHPLSKLTALTNLFFIAVTLILPSTTYAISASGLVPLINAQRAASGVSALGINSQLQSSAIAKVQDMCRNNYWAHISPSGRTMTSFITMAGYSYSAIAENLANGYMTDSSVFSGWMGSSIHRANLLNSSYKHIGVASMQCTIDGESTTLTVAHFGAPLNSATTLSKPKTMYVKTALSSRPHAIIKQTMKLEPKKVVAKRLAGKRAPSFGERLWTLTEQEYFRINYRLPLRLEQ